MANEHVFYQHQSSFPPFPPPNSLYSSYLLPEKLQVLAQWPIKTRDSSSLGSPPWIYGRIKMGDLSNCQESLTFQCFQLTLHFNSATLFACINNINTVYRVLEVHIQHDRTWKLLEHQQLNIPWTVKVNQMRTFVHNMWQASTLLRPNLRSNIRKCIILDARLWL